MRGAGLAGRGNIVQSTLDGEKRSVLDSARIDALALKAECALTKPGFVKNGPGIFEEKPAIQIHDGSEQIEKGEPAWIGAVVEEELGPKFSAPVDAPRQIEPKR